MCNLDFLILLSSVVDKNDSSLNPLEEKVTHSATIIEFFSFGSIFFLAFIMASYSWDLKIPFC